MTLDPSDVPLFPEENAPSAPVRPSPDTLRLLAERRSSKPFHLAAPAPTPAQLAALLRLATRVPDHGKLAPWRFLVMEGDGAVRAGAALAGVLAARSEGGDELRAAAAAFFTRAPLTVTLISTAAPHPKIPEWEQVLSAGAVAQTLLIAAHAMGFGAVWLTGWPCYDADARAALGLAPEERIAGFICLGTQTQAQPERIRPDATRLTTRY
ncbi:MAG: nitroreductase [Hyphomonadaceae bacterium]|nr:nitroreductase [Hyphomonadaceae bacterium]